MLSNTLNGALCVAALSSIVSTPLRADRIEVGTGVFCVTEKQVERFVAIFDGDARAAMNTVNAEEKDPTACVLGTVANLRRIPIQPYQDAPGHQEGTEDVSWLR